MIYEVWLKIADIVRRQIVLNWHVITQQNEDVLQDGHMNDKYKIEKKEIFFFLNQSQWKEGVKILLIYVKTFTQF